MRKILMSGLIIGAVATTMFAKSGFATMQKMEVKKLETKISLMQKRLKCVKSAKSSKDLATCKSKYPLINKKAKQLKNKYKQKKEALKNKKNSMKEKAKNKINSYTK